MRLLAPPPGLGDARESVREGAAKLAPFAGWSPARQAAMGLTIAGGAVGLIFGVMQIDPFQLILSPGRHRVGRRRRQAVGAFRSALGGATAGLMSTLFFDLSPFDILPEPWKEPAEQLAAGGAGGAVGFLLRRGFPEETDSVLEWIGTGGIFAAGGAGIGWVGHRLGIPTYLTMGGAGYLVWWLLPRTGLAKGKRKLKRSWFHLRPRREKTADRAPGRLAPVRAVAQATTGSSDRSTEAAVAKISQALGQNTTTSFGERSAGAAQMKPTRDVSRYTRHTAATLTIPHGGVNWNEYDLYDGRRALTNVQMDQYEQAVASQTGTPIENVSVDPVWAYRQVVSEHRHLNEGYTPNQLHHSYKGTTRIN